MSDRELRDELERLQARARRLEDTGPEHLEAARRKKAELERALKAEALELSELESELKAADAMLFLTAGAERDAIDRLIRWLDPERE